MVKQRLTENLLYLVASLLVMSATIWFTSMNLKSMIGRLLFTVFYFTTWVFSISASDKIRNRFYRAVFSLETTVYISMAFIVVLVLTKYFFTSKLAEYTSAEYDIRLLFCMLILAAIVLSLLFVIAVIVVVIYELGVTVLEAFGLI